MILFENGKNELLRCGCAPQQRDHSQRLQI
jgi:hypothetical protein